MPAGVERTLAGREGVGVRRARESRFRRLPASASYLPWGHGRSIAIEGQPAARAPLFLPSSGLPCRWQMPTALWKKAQSLVACTVYVACDTGSPGPLPR